MRAFLEWFLPIYLLLFFGLAFAWRSWRTYRKTGVNPYRLMSSHGAEGVIARYFKLLPLLSVLVAVLYVAYPELYSLLAPLVWLEQPWLAWIGVVLSLAALVIIVVAQAQMGDSWRIGVDHDNETALVQAGLFRYSRNPIFGGIMLSVIGYFLVLPNALTLLIVALDLVLVEIQVRLEEERLEAVHGDAYRAFCDCVPRWF